MINKQKLAQDRNYFKFVLSGMYRVINLDSLLDYDAKSRFNTRIFDLITNKVIP